MIAILKASTVFQYVTCLCKQNIYTFTSLKWWVHTMTAYDKYDGTTLEKLSTNGLGHWNSSNFIL